MAVILLGKKPYNWTNPDTKITYTGIRLHVMQEISTPDCGYLVDTVKVQSTSPCFPVANSLPFKTVFVPVHNGNGHLEDIIVKSYPDNKPEDKK